MTSRSLSEDYIKRCRSRIGAIDFLFNAGNFPDTIRECQETVELLLKATLRALHIDPPHWHEVSSILSENVSRLPKLVSQELDRITKLSKALRHEREIAFYGEEDFIPSNEYQRDQALHFYNETKWLMDLVEKSLMYDKK